MNHVEPGGGSRKPGPRPQGARPGNSRKKKKKFGNIIPAIILGIVGVVVIALIIMGLKSLLSGDGKQEKPQETTPVSSSILNDTPKGAEESAASGTEGATPAPSATPTPAKEADITGKEVTQLGEMVIVGDSGYDYYKFDKEKADNFAAAINKNVSAIGSDATVYSMIIPGAVDIMLPLSFLDENSDRTSDQAKAIRYVNSVIDESVKKVDIYPALKAHCDEQLYFKSDSHWTSLAAYYAYADWAGMKGIAVPALSDYEKATADGFLGNHYTYTNSSAISTPETIEYYKPKAKLTMGEGDDGGQSLFKDVSEEDPDGKYKLFLSGNNTYTKITNADKSDDSACVLVVDSNGTVIAPYIAENYQYTHVVDYRNYGKKLKDLVDSSGATDVVFCVSMSATAGTTLVDNLESLS